MLLIIYELIYNSNLINNNTYTYMLVKDTTIIGGGVKCINSQIQGFYGHITNLFSKKTSFFLNVSIEF